MGVFFCGVLEKAKDLFYTLVNRNNGCVAFDT